MTSHNHSRVSDRELFEQVDRVVRRVILDCAGVAAAPAPHERLIENGYLDSLSLATLIAELQEDFGAEFAHEDLNADNFGTVAAMARLVSRSMMVRA